MLNMVRRNFTRVTTHTVRCEIYKSPVRPSMEYGSIVWDPHQLTRIKALEAVQNIGERYVNQDWDRHKSVTTLVQTAFIMKSIHNIHGHRGSTLPPHVVKPAHALRTRLGTLNRTPAFEPGLIHVSFHSYPEAPGLGIVCPRKLLPSRTHIHTENQ